VHGNDSSHCTRALFNCPRVDTSIPTVSIWCAHTINPTIEIPTIAYIIPSVPNGSSLAVLCATMCEIAPNP
jgi:hypothetical protein